MTLSDKVLAAAEAHGVAKSNLDKIDKQLADCLADMEKDGADEAVLLPQVEELTAKLEDMRPVVDAAAKKLSALKAAEASLAARAAAATPITGAPAIIKTHPRLGPQHKAGDLFVKMALVKALSLIQNQPQDDILADRYGNDDAIKAVFELHRKGALQAADTTTATWAAELVDNDMQGFLDMIKHVSVGAALATRSMMLSFGSYGSVTVPRINNLTNPGTEPAWVGEGGAIPIQRFSFGSAILNRYKLASIVPMTREIVQQSTPSIEAIIRSAMQEAYSQNLDRALLALAPGGSAVAGVKPASLRIGEATAAGASAGTGVENLIADLTSMLSGLAAAGLGQRPLLMLNDTDFIGASMLLSPLGAMMFRDELNNGRLLGVEVVHSLNVPAGTAVMVEAAAIATAFDAPDTMVSEEATLVMADAGAAAPTMAIDAAGALGTPQQVLPDGGISVVGGVTGAGTAGYSAQSLFQRNMIAIRQLWPCSWGVMRPGAVQTKTSIDWK
jgi:HK97 family phage major capsid protein